MSKLKPSRANQCVGGLLTLLPFLLISLGCHRQERSATSRHVEPACACLPACLPTYLSCRYRVEGAPDGLECGGSLRESIPKQLKVGLPVIYARAVPVRLVFSFFHIYIYFLGGRGAHRHF